MKENSKITFILLLGIIFTAVIIVFNAVYVGFFRYENKVHTKDDIEAATDARININTATAEELTVFSGIGETLSQRIVEYRQANGGFQSVNELLNVEGIGKETLENMRAYITAE